MLHGVARCYTVLHGVTGCYTVLHGVTRCYTVLQGVTGCCTVLHGVTGCYPVLHGVTRCYTHSIINATFEKVVSERLRESGKWYSSSNLPKFPQWNDSNCNSPPHWKFKADILVMAECLQPEEAHQCTGNYLIYRPWHIFCCKHLI